MCLCKLLPLLRFLLSGYNTHMHDREFEVVAAACKMRCACMYMTLEDQGGYK